MVQTLQARPEEAELAIRDNGPAWFEAVSSRRSWRSYNGEALPEADLFFLTDLAESFVPYNDARCVVVEKADPQLFTGIVGSYGSVKGAPSALLVIARKTGRGQQHAGYTGEALVLEAGSRGLSTCWIGGSFDRTKALELTDLAEDEFVVCVSPLGFRTPTETLTDQLMHGAARSATRKPLTEIAPNFSDEWPTWARVAVECARLAPSAMNRQPWLFDFAGGELSLNVVPGRERAELTRALDCGIAMLHAEVAARQTGCVAHWVDDGAGSALAVLQCDGAEAE